uniref:Uncharacterized protein n=1 Tax=Cacopsylla melanoneura TaxID=428564 RepID=A0A8D8QUM7_9HEMI
MSHQLYCILCNPLSSPRQCTLLNGCCISGSLNRPLGGHSPPQKSIIRETFERRPPSPFTPSFDGGRVYTQSEKKPGPSSPQKNFLTSTFQIRTFPVLSA